MRMRGFVALALSIAAIVLASPQGTAQTTTRLTLLLDNGGGISPWLGRSIVEKLADFSSHPDAASVRVVTLGDREPEHTTLDMRGAVGSIFDFSDRLNALDAALRNSWSATIADPSALDGVLIFTELRVTNLDEARSVVAGAKELLNLSKSFRGDLTIYPLFHRPRETPIPPTARETFAAAVGVGEPSANTLEAFGYSRIVDLMLDWMRTQSKGRVRVRYLPDKRSPDAVSDAVLDMICRWTKSPAAVAPCEKGRQEPLDVRVDFDARFLLGPELTAAFRDSLPTQLALDGRPFSVNLYGPMRYLSDGRLVDDGAGPSLAAADHDVSADYHFRFIGGEDGPIYRHPRVIVTSYRNGTTQVRQPGLTLEPVGSHRSLIDAAARYVATRVLEFGREDFPLRLRRIDVHLKTPWGDDASGGLTLKIDADLGVGLTEISRLPIRSARVEAPIPEDFLEARMSIAVNPLQSDATFQPFQNLQPGWLDGKRSLVLTLPRELFWTKSIVFENVGRQEVRLRIFRNVSSTDALIDVTGQNEVRVNVLKGDLLYYAVPSADHMLAALGQMQPSEQSDLIVFEPDPLQAPGVYEGKDERAGFIKRNVDNGTLIGDGRKWLRQSAHFLTAALRISSDELADTGSLEAVRPLWRGIVTQLATDGAAGQMRLARALSKIGLGRGNRLAPNAVPFFLALADVILGAPEVPFLRDPNNRNVFRSWISRIKDRPGDRRLISDAMEQWIMNRI